METLPPEGHPAVVAVPHTVAVLELDRTAAAVRRIELVVRRHRHNARWAVAFRTAVAGILLPGVVVDIPVGLGSRLVDNPVGLGNHLVGLLLRTGPFQSRRIHQQTDDPAPSQ